MVTKLPYNLPMHVPPLLRHNPTSIHHRFNSLHHRLSVAVVTSNRVICHVIVNEVRVLSQEGQNQKEQTNNVRQAMSFCTSAFAKAIKSVAIVTNCFERLSFPFPYRPGSLTRPGLAQLSIVLPTAIDLKTTFSQYEQTLLPLCINLASTRPETKSSPTV
jgi:hypothetical protein